MNIVFGVKDSGKTNLLLQLAKLYTFAGKTVLIVDLTTDGKFKRFAENIPKDITNYTLDTIEGLDIVELNPKEDSELKTTLKEIFGVENIKGLSANYDICFIKAESIESIDYLIKKYKNINLYVVQNMDKVTLKGNTELLKLIHDKNYKHIVRYRLILMDLFPCKINKTYIYNEMARANKQFVMEAELLEVPMEFEDFVAYANDDVENQIRLKQHSKGYQEGINAISKEIHAIDEKIFKKYIK